jgi:flagellar biosynthesis GTPase FlhF
MKKISFSLSTVLMGIFCALIFTHAEAETYQCIKNGLTTYSGIPCADGESKRIQIKPSVVVSEQDYQRAVNQHKKDQATLQKIEAARQKEDAQREKTAKALASKSQKQKTKCDDLQLKVKWAREDVAQANPKTEAKARQKLKRALEKLALSCPVN